MGARKHTAEVEPHRSALTRIFSSSPPSSRTDSLAQTSCGGSLLHLTCPLIKPWLHDLMRRGGLTAIVAGSEETLQITVPKVTKKSLKMRSAESGDPMRVIVLRALAAAGIQVPNEELQDRRKK